jgi:hypothetical protein
LQRAARRCTASHRPGRAGSCAPFKPGFEGRQAPSEAGLRGRQRWSEVGAGRLKMGGRLKTLCAETANPPVYTFSRKIYTQNKRAIFIYRIRFTKMQKRD